MTLETVMNEIHEWYEKIIKKYAEVIKFEIDKDEKDIFVVNFDTNRYIAQLIVEDIGFHPHRFVSFIVLDIEKEIHQNYPYYFYDGENDSVKVIIEQLDRGIEFIVH